jgi:hypothetical protein
MKSRAFWPVVLALLFGAAVWALSRARREHATPIAQPEPRLSREQLVPARVAPPVIAAPTATAVTTAAAPLPPAPARPRFTPLETPIQDKATIDFSIGAPVVRSDGDDKDALERALKNMAEATKDVKFEAPAGVKK